MNTAFLIVFIESALLIQQQHPVRTMVQVKLVSPILLFYCFYLKWLLHVN
jgi:hypothetical protein